MNFNTYPSAWDLRYFQEIASTGNLSRAAERLGVGQPALSLALKRLEDGMQAKLFLRRHRGLVLTEAGERLHRESGRLLSAWEAVVSETARSTTEVRGKFRLGIHPSVAIYALKDSLSSLYRVLPNIEIQLVHGLSRQVAEAVISGSLDFAFVVNPVRHPDLVIHRLASDEVCFWKVPEGLEDVLIYDPKLMQSQALLKKLNKKQVRFRRNIESENLEVITALADGGAGVAILPTRVAQAGSTRLKKLEGFASYRDEVAFVHRADLPKTAATKSVLNFFKSISI